MKEILYDIPVRDIFSHPCECPICAMKQKLDEDEVAFTMGPSYMEDDIRLTTDQIGFCAHHMRMMYAFQNQLGLGLILNTHMKHIIENVKSLQKKGRQTTGGLFSKKTHSTLFEYTNQVAHSCFICNRIQDTFQRYLITTLRLYEKDMEFRKKFESCQGFCIEHYGLLFELAPSYLSGQTLQDFTECLNKVFLNNFTRMQEEVSWFVDKFDYRNKDADWGTSKDAIPRAMTKVNGVL